MTESHDAEDFDARAKAEQADARVKRLQEVEDLKWLMAHAAGRRIATRILERTGVRRTSFHTNGSTMAFNEGRRDVGLWFEAEVLETAPDAYLKMLKEYRSE